MAIIQIAYAAIIGILLGFVAIWTRSVWPSVLIHFHERNPLLIGSIWKEEQIDQFYQVIKSVTITCGVIVIAIMYFIYRKPYGIKGFCNRNI